MCKEIEYYLWNVDSKDGIINLVTTALIEKKDAVKLSDIDSILRARGEDNDTKFEINK